MDFPAYVPAAVQKYVTELLEGYYMEPWGLQTHLAEAEQALATLNRTIERHHSQGEECDLPRLWKQMAEAEAHRDLLLGDVNCLIRLACDERMEIAFTMLGTEFTDDAQWRSFTHSAWASRVDFAKYRDRLKRAEELKSEIADAAENLAKKIGQFADTGTMGPGEFYSIPALLRKTDNRDGQHLFLNGWRHRRGYIFGDPPKQDSTVEKPSIARGAPLPAQKIVIVRSAGKVKIDKGEEARDMLRIAWRAAPEFSALLITLANTARAFKPSEPGMVGAAIETRQRSAKTEYLRAFINLLTKADKFELTSPIKRAIAIVANVVINLPDVDVSDDDVRKVLGKPGKK